MSKRSQKSLALIAVILIIALFAVSPWQTKGSLEVQTELKDITIYQLPKDEFQFTIHNATEPQTIKNWSKQFGKGHIIINGFYFNADYSPPGMLTIDSEDLHTKIFDYDRSAVVDLTETLTIIDTSEPFTDNWTTAAQSYPILVKDGKAMVKEDSGLLAKRSFIGTDQENVYIGIADKNISLYQLSQELASIQIEWNLALNLDGGPSTGLTIQIAKDKNLNNSLMPVPSVIVGEEKDAN